MARLEANGIVTKGTGIGGAAQFVGELDFFNPNVSGIINCNAPSYTVPGAGSFFSGVAPYLTLDTGDDAVLQISAP